MRFATKRFIGEYDCTTDRIYRVDNHLGSTWEIADPPGYPAGSAEPKLRWADAIVLVYSVTDRVSFDETSRLRYIYAFQVFSARVYSVRTNTERKKGNVVSQSNCGLQCTIPFETRELHLPCTSRFLVSHARKGRKVPPVVLLVGNKADLSCSPGERMVSALEGQKRAKEIEAHAFHEISVRESVDQVTSLCANISPLSFSLSRINSVRLSKNRKLEKKQLSFFDQQNNRISITVSYHISLDYLKIASTNLEIILLKP